MSDGNWSHQAGWIYSHANRRQRVVQSRLRSTLGKLVIVVGPAVLTSFGIQHTVIVLSWVVYPFYERARRQKLRSE